MNAITIRQPAAKALIEASHIVRYRQTMRNAGADRLDRIEACERLLDIGGASDALEASRVLDHLCGRARFVRSARHG